MGVALQLQIGDRYSIITLYVFSYSLFFAPYIFLGAPDFSPSIDSSHFALF